jgi:nucleotide-binding universal stress UspA family protein
MNQIEALFPHAGAFGPAAGTQPAQPANDRFDPRCPVTVVDEDGDAPRFPLSSRRIIAAVDFSPAGERARRVAIAMAHANDAVLDLVHVLDAFEHIFVRSCPELVTNPEAVLEGIQTALGSRARAARLGGVCCFSTSLVGAPGLELARHATRTGADLMVVGRPARIDDPFRSAWSARALAQLVHLTCWRGVVVRVRP